MSMGWSGHRGARLHQGRAQPRRRLRVRVDQVEARSGEQAAEEVHDRRVGGVAGHHRQAVGRSDPQPLGVTQRVTCRALTEFTVALRGDQHDDRT
jgi:hypothetical protein